MAHATTAGWLTVDAATIESLSFAVPSHSLTIGGIGGTDSVTISGANGAINLGAIPFTVRAETIIVAAGANLTAGDITLAAQATNVPGATTTDLAAKAEVAGTLRGQVVVVSSTARQDLSQTGQGLNGAVRQRTDFQRNHWHGDRKRGGLGP